jgi:alanine racemase
MIIKANLDNLLYNAKHLKSMTKAMFCAVVKDDAYGHGIVVSKILEPVADCFAVVNIFEAIELRNHIKKHPIQILGRCDFDSTQLLVKNNFIQSVHCLQDLIALNDIAKSNNIVLEIDIEINSGFNRLGVSPQDCSQVARQLTTCTNLKLRGVFTHFCDYLDLNFTQTQFDIFVKSAKNFAQFNPILHCINSYGMELSQYHLDMVRCGIGLFGFGNSKLKQVISVQSKIVALNFVTRGSHISYGSTILDRDCWVATVKGGYGQGLIRGFYKHAKVEGTLCPIVGVITMDYFMLDVTSLVGQDKKIDLLDKVVTISDDSLRFDDIAKQAGTIPWQLLVAFKNSVKLV